MILILNKENKTSESHFILTSNRNSSCFKRKIWVHIKMIDIYHVWSRQCWIVSYRQFFAGSLSFSPSSVDPFLWKRRISSIDARNCTNFYPCWIDSMLIFRSYELVYKKNPWKVHGWRKKLKLHPIKIDMCIFSRRLLFFRFVSMIDRSRNKRTAKFVCLFHLSRYSLTSKANSSMNSVCKDRTVRYVNDKHDWRRQWSFHLQMHQIGSHTHLLVRFINWPYVIYYNNEMLFTLWYLLLLCSLNIK
jgi:hypothetical protein